MMKLPQTLSTFTLLSSAIAGMVGSGWLLGPMACAQIAGPAAIMTWLLAGLLMMVIAATFVRLARAIPTTGGTVRFFQMSYGHFAGFSFSWIAWLAWIAVPPIETMVIVQYSSHILPHLMTQGATPALTWEGMLMAMICMAVMGIINNFGVHVYNKVNACILLFKLLIPATTVVILISSHFHTNNMIASGFMPYGIQSVFSALPLAGVIYSFIGFNPVIQLAAEAKNPKKSIPISIFGALAVCIVLYTAVQVAFIAALPSHYLSHGWHHLSFAGDTAPFVGLFSLIGVILFVKALYIDAAVSPFGTALVQSMATSRLTLAMAENGYLPQALLKLNAKGSPTRATLLNTLVGFTFFMPFPSWQHLVGFLSSSLVLGYVVGPMSLMMMSSFKPNLFPNRSTWKTPTLCLAALYICNLMIYWSGWGVIAKMAIVFVIGYGVLMIMMTFSPISRRKIGHLNIAQGFWVIIYMIGMTTLSCLSTFGGYRIIPFGFDFFSMAVFTMGIYGYAYFCARKTAASPARRQLATKKQTC